MSSGPSGPNGGQGNGNQPSYLNPQAPGVGGTYGAGYAGIGGAPVSSAQLTPYQQGQTPQQIQAGLGRLQNGMGMAAQSYKNMGQLQGQFQQNANNAGNSAYNPAIGAYQSAMNQNSQNIGAQLASQRGAAVDPGLAARNVGQAGASAAQQGAGQMSAQVAAYKGQEQGLAMGAGQAQGQMAGVYGNIANAYAQAGLANQGQILNAIAAQNSANVAMQSNVNSSNVAMQSNINSANVAMTSNVNDVMAQQMMNNNNNMLQQYGMQLGYNSNLYNSYMGEQGSARAGGCTGGMFGGGGFLGLGFSLAKGGEVGKHGTPHVLSDKKMAFAQRLNAVPKFAKGGRIPEKTRIKMAKGGYVKKMADGGDAGDCGAAADQQTDNQDSQLAGMGGGNKSPYSLGVCMNLNQALGQNDMQQMASSGGAQVPASNTGKILAGLMQVQSNPGFNRGPSGGGGGCGMMSGIGNMVSGAQGSLAQGNGALTGSMAGLFGGSGGAAAAGAGSGADAAAALAAAHGGQVSRLARGGKTPMAHAPSPHVPMAHAPSPHIPHMAQGGKLSAKDHIMIGLSQLQPHQKQALMQRITQIMQAKQGGGQQQPIKMAQGSIVPDTSNPNFWNTPNIQMQSNVNGMANQGQIAGAMGGQGGPPQGANASNVAMQSNVNGMANQGQLLGAVGSQQGPAMANFALAGSPNPGVAMPSSGMPMGNAQTRGGGPMPSPFGKPPYAQGNANTSNVAMQSNISGKARGGMIRGRST